MNFYFYTNDKLRSMLADQIKSIAKNYDMYILLISSRDILKLCKTKGECSYYEMKYQLEYDVLLKPEEFYNAFVGGKIHRNHILGLQDPEDDIE